MNATMVDIDGPVHLIDHGGEGPPMLLVHGLGGSHLDWSDVAPALSRRHHVYAVDLIGFGRTPVNSRHATVGDNVRLVDAVIDRVGDGQPVTLMGNSMGGLISLVVAAKRPRKVAALVLVDPALPRTRGGRLSVMLFLSFMVIATPGVGPMVVSQSTRRAGAERMVDDAMRLCTVDSSRIDPLTREAHIRLTQWRHEQEQPYAAFVQASRSLVRWLWDWGYVERFMSSVVAPTLLIHGARDRVVPVGAAHEAARQRPDWTVEIMPDTGHIPQMECPAAFLAIVEHWLASAGDAAPELSGRLQASA